MSLVDMVGKGAIAAGLVAVALEIIALVLAARAHARTRRLARALVAGGWSRTAPPAPPPKALAIYAAMPPLLVLGRMVYAVQGARATILEEVTSVGLGGKVSFASFALLDELGAILGGMLGLGLVLVLGAVAAALAASACGRGMGLTRAIALAARDREAALAWAARPGPGAPVLIAVTLSFVVLGLGPVIAGAVSGSWLELRALDEVARAAPEVKTALYEQAQRAAGTLFDHGYRAAIVGVACATVGSGFLLWFASAQRARERMLGGPSPADSASGRAVAAAILVAAAIACIVLARSMKHENETPWPPGAVNDGLGVETPALDGPDSLDLGPLVTVTVTGLAVDYHRQDIAGVEAHLRAYRANFPLLHPADPAPREILLACAPNATSERVFAAIETARRAGYDGARFVFESAHAVVRPVIGTVTLKQVTAARVSIGADGAPLPAGADSVGPEDAPTCAQLAARVVQSRRIGRSVVLVPPPTPPRPHQPLQE